MQSRPARDGCMLGNICERKTKTTKLTPASSARHLPKDLHLHLPALIVRSLDHCCWAPIVSDGVYKFKDSRVWFLGPISLKP